MSGQAKGSKRYLCSLFHLGEKRLLKFVSIGESRRKGESYGSKMLLIKARAGFGNTGKISLGETRALEVDYLAWSAGDIFGAPLWAPGPNASAGDTNTLSLFRASDKSPARRAHRCAFVFVWWACGVGRGRRNYFGGWYVKGLQSPKNPLGSGVNWFIDPPVFVFPPRGKDFWPS